MMPSKNYQPPPPQPLKDKAVAVATNPVVVGAVAVAGVGLAIAGSAILLPALIVGAGIGWFYQKGKKDGGKDGGTT
jgi:hypothetical protein